PHRLPVRRDHVAARAAAASGSGTGVSTWVASAGNLSLQACAGAGYSLSIVAEEQTSAAPPTDCPGARRTFPGDKGNPARTPGPSLHRSGADNSGSSLLAEGR